MASVDAEPRLASRQGEGDLGLVEEAALLEESPKPHGHSADGAVHRPRGGDRDSEPGRNDGGGDPEEQDQRSTIHHAGKTRGRRARDPRPVMRRLAFPDRHR
jgi:hypothetical protein